MRLALTVTLALGVSGCFWTELFDAIKTASEDDDPPPAADAAPPAVDSSVVGGLCGVEQTSKTDLCAATSLCPSVAVDTGRFPHCGFRIRGPVVDLVCACGTAICAMGVFATCQEAARLLENQTEQQVCLQVAEGFCSEFGGTSDASTPPANSSGGTSGKPPSCDRQCVAECGGGAACAAVCNCN